MAKKNVQVEEVKEQKQDHPTISYEDLVHSRVRVEHKDGVMFYLDPAPTQGEFVLRIVPQPIRVEIEELPADWKRPTKEETASASNKVDWGELASEEQEADRVSHDHGI